MAGFSAVLYLIILGLLQNYRAGRTHEGDLFELSLRSAASPICLCLP